MNILKLFFLLIIPLILVFSCKEKDEIEPVEVPFNSRVEIDYTGALINDGDWIEIDGVRYTHKLDSFNVISVLDSGYLLTSISADSVLTTIQIISSIDTTITTDTSYVIDISTPNGDTITVINTITTYDTVLKDTSYYIVNVKTDNYLAPGGSLLLQLYRDNRFVVDITKFSFIDTIPPFQTADSIIKPQKTRIYPDLVGLAVVIDDIWALTIGTTTITFVATLPTIAHVTAGITKAVNDALSIPGGNLSSILDTAIDMQTYIELTGVDNVTTFTVIASVNGVQLFTPYATDKYILKIKGGGEIHLGTVSEYQLDLRAKTIQIESKTGSAINITTSTGYGAEITYY